jgi:ABC-2 type transport system ATP-binding protein
MRIFRLPVRRTLRLTWTDIDDVPNPASAHVTGPASPEKAAPRAGVNGDAPLVVRGVRKGYRRGVVLRDVSFEVRVGEAVALLGSNGAGKSTLLGCLTGDRLPDAGEVRLCGADPFSDLAAAARCMGFVPEQPFLYGELTVGEMLQFVAAARGIAVPDAEREAARLLSLLGLAGAEGTLCRELSQGMGRKTAIIAALLHGPRVILLDEALNGLDRTSAGRLIAELDARRAAGAAVLLSSHDLDLVAEWCGRGLMLAPGGVWRVLEGSDWEAWRKSPTLNAGT